MSYRHVYYKGFRQTLEKIEVWSNIVPYTDPEDFWRMTRSEVAGYKLFVQTDVKGMVMPMTGLPIRQVLLRWKYQVNLW
jgi:hypothetical protein